MKLRDLPSWLSERFMAEELSLQALGDPTAHQRLGVQFVDDTGHPAGGFTEDADRTLKIAPFVGPFYDLPLVGISPGFKVGLRWKCINPVVRLPDGELTHASCFSLRVKMAKLKGLADELGIPWYSITHGDVYIAHTDFDECYKYAKSMASDENGRI